MQMAAALGGVVTVPAAANGQQSSILNTVAAVPRQQRPRRQSPCSSRRWHRHMMAASSSLEPAAAAAAIRWEPSPQVLATLQSADAICFDVDSTFCADESIDELAAFLGVGEKVASLTAQAMGGAMLFQDSLAMRLNAMQPSAAAVERYLAGHPPLLSPGIPELVQYLQASGRGVYLVSGGFRQIIHPVAEQLGIPLSRVFANNLLFTEDGSYAGFDPHEFTSRSGGKREALEFVKRRDGLQRVVMVGDGATDAEARAPGAADLFVCYGGVVLRENVALKADWAIKDIGQLLAALQSGGGSGNGIDASR